MERTREESENEEVPYNDEEIEFIFASIDYMASRNEIQRSSENVTIVREHMPSEELNLNVCLRARQPSVEVKEGILQEVHRVCEDVSDVQEKAEKSMKKVEENNESGGTASVHVKEEEMSETRNEPSEDVEKLIMEARVAEAWRLLEETNYLSDSDCDVKHLPHESGKPSQEEPSSDVSTEVNDEVECATSTQETSEEKLLHQCTKCGMQCIAASSLEQHIKYHAKEKQHKCFLCFEEFPTMGDLRTHFLMHSERAQESLEYGEVQQKGEDSSGRRGRGRPKEYIFECSDCGKKFKKKTELEVHSKCHYSEGLSVCKVYKESCKNESSLKEHITGTHIGEKPHVCETYGKEFRYSSLLETHKRVHNGEKPFKGNVCRKRFTQKGNLNVHSRVHLVHNDQAECSDSKQEAPEERQVHQCAKCGMQCSSASSLEQHIKYHAKEKQHKCFLCFEEFPTMGDLRKHFLMHSERAQESLEYGEVQQKGEDSSGRRGRGRPKEYIFECSDCGKKFKKKNELEVHSKCHYNEGLSVCKVYKESCKNESSLKEHITETHIGAKPHVCETCGKEFRCSSHLESHKRVHNGEKPFKCNVCRKRFTQKGNLNVHSRVHTGERPFMCNVCGKGFKQLGALSNHMPVHEREKPYKCSICGKGFTQKGNLKDHSRVHTGERPFMCNVCGKQFKLRGALSNHMPVHEREKPYKCTICGKGFSLKGNMKKHLSLHEEA